MPFPYHIWLRKSAYEYLESLEFSERDRLFEWIEQLGVHPFRDGDFTERGDDGREWEVVVVNGHSVAWWVDDAVCEVKVIKIRSADT